MIAEVFHDRVTGSQEPDKYVEIRDDDDSAMYVSGWTLREEANHPFKSPDYVMESGESVSGVGRRVSSTVVWIQLE